MLHPIRSAVRCSLVLAAAALSAFVTSAQAASFGVPTSPAPPSGYFVLVAPDTVNDTVSIALGDVARFVTLTIENHEPGLRVDLYDPGLFNAALGAGQLDINLGSPPAAPAGIRYRLFGPDGTGVLDANLADQIFLGDTAATDRRLVMLYDDARAPAGLYHLVVSMRDGVELEQDVGVFGVSVPGKAAYGLGLTVGRVDEGGAAITEPLEAFPLVITPSAGADAVGPLCGLQFVTYDLDAALNGDEPPFAQITTTGGFAFPPAGSSGDARWWEVDLGGINPGALDSSDHGAWSWSFSELAQPEDCFGNLLPAIEMNAFSMQVLNYGAPPRDFTTWADLPSAPPFIVFNPDGPRRIYLPSDTGGAPLKETLNHRAQVVSGYPVLALGQASTVEAVLTLDNPSPYALTNVFGRTYLAPSAEVTDPVIVSATGGVTASIIAGDPRGIEFRGAVAAGGRAEITYRVDATPATLGPGFLTGDGISYTTTARPTYADYETPFTDPTSQILLLELQGPLCELAIDTVLPDCQVRAQLSASTLRTCPGTPVRLDATGSEVFACPGGIAAYQWSVNGAIIFPYPAAGIIDVTPLFNDTWEVSVACSTDPDACFDTASVTFDLYPAPLVDAGPDRVVCSGGTIDLTAALSGGSPPYSGLRWSTAPAGEPGDGATTPAISVAPTQDTVYTFSADDGQGCSGSDSVSVDVRSPLPALSPDPPTLCGGGTVDISATAGFASYSWSTTPRGAAGDGATTQVVTADAGGVTYTVTVTDDAGCQGTQSVTTQAGADPVPGAMNWSLRVAKSGAADLRYSWQDLPDPAAGYQLMAFDCTDADGDRQCDVPPTQANMAASASFVIVAPGVQQVIEPGGVNRQPKLIFSKVRALSPCSLTPGAFAVEP